MLAGRTCAVINGARENNHGSGNQELFTVKIINFTYLVRDFLKNTLKGI